MLKVNKTLEVLLLWGNHPGTAGVKPIAEVLKVNKTLSELKCAARPHPPNEQCVSSR